MKYMHLNIMHQNMTFIASGLWIAISPDVAIACPILLLLAELEEANRPSETSCQGCSKLN